MNRIIVQGILLAVIIFIIGSCDNINLIRAAFEGSEYIQTIVIVHKGPLYPRGCSDQLELIVTTNTGKTTNETTNAGWTSDFPSMINVTGTGFISTSGNGTAAITATYKGIVRTVSLESIDAVCVSTTGNDANIGSSGSPFRTIFRGIQEADTRNLSQVWVQTGIYIENVEVHTGRSLYGGYSSDFLGRTNDPAQTIIQAPATGLNAWAMRTQSGVSYFTIVEGFTIDAGNNPGGGSATNTAGVLITDAGLTLRNNRIFGGNGFSSPSYSSSGISSTAGALVTIVENNYINGGTGVNSYGIKIQGGFIGPIRNNVIVGGNGNNTSVGVSIMLGASMPYIRNNTIDGGVSPSLATAIEARAGTPIIQNNILFYSSSSGYCCYEQAVAGTPSTFENNNLFGSSVLYYSVSSGALNTITDIKTKSGIPSCTDNLNIILTGEFYGEYQLNYDGTTAPVLTGGLDGLGLGWGFAADKDSKTRTPAWSMGAYEVDP